MDDNLALMLLSLACLGLLALVLRWGVIGVRGGSFSRDENPAAYWVAVTVLAFGSGAALLMGLLR